MGLLRRIRAILEQSPSERAPRDVVRQQDGKSRDCVMSCAATGVHRQVGGLQRQIERLERENEHLKQQLGAERRAGRRQAAPFAKKRPQGRGGRPGRRPGARYGRQGRRPCPARVDETIAAPAPTSCPDCGGGGRSDRRGVAVSGRPSSGAPSGAPLRHRGRPLLAVSAAYPGPARPADLRRVAGGPRTARSRRGRAGRGVAHPRCGLAGQGRRPAADPLRPAGDAGGLANLLHRAPAMRGRPTRRCASRFATLRWSRPMKPVGASAAAATGCGRPSPRRRPSSHLRGPRIRRRASGPGSRLRRRAVTTIVRDGYQWNWPHATSTASAAKLVVQRLTDDVSISLDRSRPTRGWALRWQGRRPASRFSATGATPAV